MFHELVQVGVSLKLILFFWRTLKIFFLRLVVFSFILLKEFYTYFITTNETDYKHIYKDFRIWSVFSWINKSKSRFQVFTQPIYLKSPGEYSNSPYFLCGIYFVEKEILYIYICFLRFHHITYTQMAYIYIYWSLMP